MKKILSLLVFALLCAGICFGQDVRRRTPATVISDVLATMPCSDSSWLAQGAQDLAISAPATVELLSQRLREEGPNSRVEYALSALATYVSDPANARYRTAVREGFSRAVAAQANPVFRQFLLSQLRLIATPEDIGLYRQYVSDPLCGPAALAAIADLGGKDVLLGLIGDESVPVTALSGIIAREGYTEAETALLRRAATLSDPVEKTAVAEALGRIGSEASLNWLKTHSMADYMAVLRNVPAKKAINLAKEVLKSGTSGEKCAAASVIMEKASSSKGLKTLRDILKSDDRPLRNTAISAATAAYGADAVAPVLTSQFAKLGEEAKTDIVSWFGANKKGESLVLSQLDAPGELGDAAVRAAGLIGGDAACRALVSQLSGSRSAQALDALKSFRGDLTPFIVNALGQPVNETQLNQLMNLASAREIKAAASQLLARAAEGSPEAAYALAGVVTPDQADAVATILRDCPDALVPSLQKALSSAIHTLSPEDQGERALALMDEGAGERFYPVLAGIGTDRAAEALRALSPQDPAAREALLSMDNPSVLPDLLAAAKEGNETALKRYVDLLSASEQNLDRRRLGLAEALSLAQSPALRRQILDRIGDIPTMKAFLLAGKSLDDGDAGVRMAAADAVRKIAGRTTEEINYDDLKAGLEKARALYAARGEADDGYAVDEIDKMLREATPSPRSELTAEEKAQGFVMLFDGSDLSQWHGDMEGYTVVNGTIYVSANYGATGNLYTNAEYRNFVYRFEFCFLQEGVNNGVGIRTPENVDAAYEGMCEVQILDHDAPAYAGWLQPYQVHGSIYGVVPAKRIRHKPLGEWGTEEIRVEGNHITVTVNGEVITDADVRKVTGGHNVAPDGSDKNPYTIDGHNHPGMFNYKGHISFCGHGSGLKIRNVRILDLGYKK